MKRFIEAVPYKNEWSNMFEVEAKLIKQALGDNCWIPANRSRATVYNYLSKHENAGEKNVRY